MPVKLFLVAEVLRYFSDIFNYLFKIRFIHFLILFLFWKSFYPHLGFFVGKFHRTDHQLKLPIQYTPTNGVYLLTNSNEQMAIAQLYRQETQKLCTNKNHS